jgi:hypothetical protein
MEKKLFVVERECPHCGCPIGEGIAGVREAREGDHFGPRQITDDEAPSHCFAEAAIADAETAIVIYKECEDCKD